MENLKLKENRFSQHRNFTNRSDVVPKSLTCPHCKKRAMPLSRKLSLGPLRSLACESCGDKVSVSRSFLIGVAPAVILFFVGNFYDSLTLILLGLFLSFVLIAFLSVKVNLVKR